MSQNELAKHLYSDGHVTHNWQQSRFLQEAFLNEDALQAEVEKYGTTKPKRNTMLDWRDKPIPSERTSSSRSSSQTWGSSSSRSSCSSCRQSCRGYSQRSGASGRSFRSGTSSFRSQFSCTSTLSSSSSGCSCSCGCHIDDFSTGRLSTGRSLLSTSRTDSTVKIDRLREKKRRLEERLQELEVELHGSTTNRTR